MGKRLRRLIGLSLAALLIPIGLGRLPAALACSCAPESLNDHFTGSDVVFDGVATQRIDANPSDNPGAAQFDTITWRFDVLSTLKGTTTDPQDVGTPRDDSLCGSDFTIGTAYRVFARRDGTSLSTATCSGNFALGGYRLAAGDGGVLAFGRSTFHGSAGGLPLVAPVVGIAATSTGRGYWLAAADGGVFAYGDARFFGSAGGSPLNARVVGITPTPTGAGYWLTAADGGVFAYGDARFLGSAAGLPLGGPVVGIAATGSGAGYWLLGLDGGVFAYGDADYSGRIAFGSAAAAGQAGSSTSPPFPQWAMGITASHSGTGYWITDFRGGVRGFGDTAPLEPSFTAAPSTVGIARTTDPPGLVLTTSNGSVTTYGTASAGDLTGHRLNDRVVGVSA